MTVMLIISSFSITYLSVFSEDYDKEDASLVVGGLIVFTIILAIVAMISN